MTYTSSRMLGTLAVGCATLLAPVSPSQANSVLRGTQEIDEKYHCSQGCPLDVDQVCTGDGAIFQNECFAKCQGIDLTTVGPCDGDEDIPFVAGAGNGGDRGVPPSVMEQYADDGFVYIGSVGFLDSPQDYQPFKLNHEPLLDDFGLPNDPESDDTDGIDVALRITPKGDAYVHTSANREGNEQNRRKERQIIRKLKHKHKMGAKRTDKTEQYEIVDLPLEERTMQDEFESDLFPEDGSLREETVIGMDTRGLVQDTSVDPYIYIGEMDYEGYGEGGCTGTIIAPDAIITAAHCVYNRGSKMFLPLKRFVPGRYRSYVSSRAQFFNTGIWEVRDATFFSKWTQKNDISYDVAVVRLNKHETHGSIGDKIGFLELTSPDCKNIDKLSMIAGYPNDKSNGQMWESGTCDGWSHVCGSNRIFHRCDTYGGQSGSAMIDSEGKIFGIHTHGGYSWNSGVALTEEHLKQIERWVN